MPRENVLKAFPNLRGFPKGCVFCNHTLGAHFWDDNDLHVHCDCGVCNVQDIKWYTEHYRALNPLSTITTTTPNNPTLTPQQQTALNQAILSNPSLQSIVAANNIAFGPPNAGFAPVNQLGL